MKRKLPEMVKLYFEEEKSLMQVAQIIGCSDQTVKYQLNKNGYELRSRSEALKGREVTQKMRDSARRLGLSRVGPKNPAWKGKVNRGGYVGVRLPNHPFASKCGYVMEHRLVMEEYLGRYLDKDEDVHHVNGDKKDNRIKNLMVMKKSEHSRFHGNERIANKTHNNFIYTTEEQVKKAITKGGTVKEMADRLNIERSTLYKKIKRHNLSEWYENWRKTNV